MRKTIKMKKVDFFTGEVKQVVLTEPPKFYAEWRCKGSARRGNFRTKLVTRPCLTDAEIEELYEVLKDTPACYSEPIKRSIRLRIRYYC